MGTAHERPATARLLRERVTRRDGCGLARTVRSVFRDERRAGLCFGRRRRLVESRRARPAGGAVGGSANVAMNCDLLVARASCPFDENPKHTGGTPVPLLS